MKLSGACAREAHRFAILLGSASFLTMAVISAARAQEATQVAAANVQVAAAAPQQVAAAQEEEILVTGSLIHGAEAVGVPVTSLGVEDFKTTGAVTIGDLFKNVPAVYMIPQNDVIAGGGYIARAQNINLRNLSTRGTRTLLLIDNMRFPNQGRGGCQLDPSIIPQLAVDHIDLLADGASATYGSDAVAGVINVILKRGYEGATTQLQISGSQDYGHAAYTFSQLYGRRWDTGGITLSYEWYKQNHTGGGSRPYLTQDFFAFQGLDDRRNLIHSRPGVVTVGAPQAAAGAPTGFAANLGQTCSNCFSIPKGQNGVGLTWSTILANPGVKNQVELFADAWAEPTQKRNAVTMTFDQEIMDGVSLFVDGFYSNRRSLMHQQAGNNSFSVTVPTNNPYYPIGAPAGVRVNYDLNLELDEPGRVAASEIADRYNAGFNKSLAGPGQRVVSLYRTPASPNTPALDSGGRLKYRGRIGWTDVTGAWSVTTFVNFIPHYNSNSVPLPPPCFQVGNTPCNASGNPAFAQYTQQYDILTSYVPGQYIFDLSIGYQTGGTPANDYLKNIRLQLTISNILNKEPPFAYQISPPGGAQAHAHFSTTAGSSVGIDGRVIAFSLTKEW